MVEAVLSRSLMTKDEAKPSMSMSMLKSSESREAISASSSAVRLNFSMFSSFNFSTGQK